MRHPSWKTEIYGLWIALRTDPMIVLLFPMFFASNWFYTWQFNDYNGEYIGSLCLFASDMRSCLGAVFNIRTRGLNNLVYWLSQIVGSVAIGFLLDQHGLRRRVRAFAGWSIVFCMVFIVHIWAYFYQRSSSCFLHGSVLSLSIHMCTENIHVRLFSTTRKGWISTTRGILGGYGCTSLWECWMLCGRRLHTG